MMKNFNLSVLAMLLFIFGIADLSAQTRISFARGKSSAIVSGTLGGRGASNSIKKFVVENVGTRAAKYTIIVSIE